MSTCRNIIYNLSLNEMTENRAQVSNTHFGLFFFFFFFYSFVWYIHTMPSKEKKLNEKDGVERRKKLKKKRTAVKRQ